MKHPTSQDRSHRLAFSSAELNSLLFRVLVRNRLLSPATRSAFYLRFPVRAWDSVVRVRNRCVLTGRSGSPVSRFKLSRITFRELANSGQLPGVARSSWLAIVCPPHFFEFYPPPNVLSPKFSPSLVPIASTVWTRSVFSFLLCVLSPGFDCS